MPAPAAPPVNGAAAASAGRATDEASAKTPPSSGAAREARGRHHEEEQRKPPLPVIKEAHCSEAFLRQVFEICDKDHNGKINKRELIIALRQSAEIADFFHLPRHIREIGGSQDQFEAVFQAIDRDDNREIDWNEFTKFYTKRRDHPQRSG
jgi:hypothetical protein